MAIPQKISRGIEESRNGKLTFFGDQGRKNLFHGVLRKLSIFKFALLLQEKFSVKSQIF
jgi:hypothetical protein